MSELEARLRAAVGELLHTDPERIAVDRSLISLGFDSILAITLQHHLQDTLGLTISVADLMAGRTISELAAGLTTSDRPALAARQRPDRLPLSFAQQRLWFLDQLALGGAYTVAGAVRLTGSLDREALAASLTAIVARHEALRTVFPVTDGEPEQRVLPAARVPLPMTDLSGIPAQRATEQAEVVASQQVERSFDLTTGPLLRARLVRLSNTVHELVVTVHHIACDGWSMAAMLDELATGYRHRVAGTLTEPAPLALQYADYTLWQREWLDGTEHESQLAYWRTQLDGAPPALRLPADRPRSGGIAGGSYHHVLPSGLTDPLHTIAREAQATLFMTLAATFTALLARLSGQPDVVLGTPVANRPDPALEPLIGFFVNTLALRTDLSDDPSFRTLLARMRATTLAAYRYQDLPFEHLVESVGRAGNPLFEVLFTVQHTALPRYQLPDGDGGTLRAVPRELDVNAAKFDLTLTIQHDDDDNLRARWEYRRDLFDEATVVRFAQHYQTLLEQLVADPDRPLSTLSLLTSEQQHHQLHIWNASLSTGDGTLAPDQIALRAVAAPDAIALVAGDRELTYAELLTRVDALAAHLRGLGVGPDVLVGLCAQRGVELVIGLLAILRAGGAYLPLDPTYPSARLATILTDAAPTIILTQHHLLADLPAHPALTVLLSDPLPAGSALVCDADPDSLAYVLYTSGSTGTPKGVAITHENLTGFLAAIDARFGRGPQTWLALTSTAFDISVLELIWTLAAGHRVVLLDESSAGVAAAIERHGVTHLQTTPSFASRLLSDFTPTLSTLDTLLLGGEAFSATMVGQLRKLTTTKVINGYGPTEASVYATMHPVDPDEDDIPIGRPVRGARAYILDRHLQPVPIGVTGELYLSGHGIGRGYLNRPGLTAERFLPNPFGLPGDRMYRTGDLARYRADGVIEFLGRVDHQVKVRGYRIELDEIDAVLAGHPLVRDSVTVARDDHLVSYVVSAETALPDLNGYLRERLPTWMRPSQLVPIAELPLTPNGKIDRGRLPTATASTLTVEPVRPRTTTEHRIADIWTALLDRADLDVHDNFFELGGHSLLATQAIARIRTVCDVDLPLRAIFEHPTIAELARVVRGAAATGRPSLVHRTDQDRVPLSFAQQRLWFLEQLTPDSGYAIAGTVTLTGTLDRDRLAKALTAIVGRHEALRTVFPVVDGQPCQRVLPARPVDLPLTELTVDDFQRFAQREARTPFDLAGGPLLRVHLVRLADDRHELIVVVHHIVCDGWSLNLMLDELSTIYRDGDTLPSLDVRYADYTLWQREWLAGKELERQLDFWRTELAGAPPALELPTDRPRPAEPSYAGASYRQALPSWLVDSVSALARGNDATLFMALGAAFTALLGRLSGQQDVVLGTPIANRADPALEPLIGFFVNTVALRANLADDPSFRTLLGRLRETTLAAYQHQDLPFEYLIEQLQVARDLGRNPLFQVMFTVAHNALPARSLPGLELRASELATGAAKFDLTLTVQHDHDGTVARWEYRRDLFDEPTIARIAGHFSTLLAGIVAEPDRPLSTLELLTPGERRVQVEQPIPDQNAGTVLDLIEARARPAAIALVAEDQVSRDPTYLTPPQPTAPPVRVAALEESPSTSSTSGFPPPGQEPRGSTADARQQDHATLAVTYAELTSRADALAARLRELGVGPDVLVGLCARRGPDLIVGLLAILRAGGAYVPLDPAYPAARIEQILTDAKPAIILTQQDIPVRGAQTILLEEPLPALTEPLPPPRLEPHHLAYVIYTSGSTGTPKGVAVSHANLLASTAARQATYDLPVTGLVLLSSVAFDTSVASIFWSLCHGATLHLPAEGRQLELDYLIELANRPDVSHLVCLPSLYQLLLERTRDEPVRLRTVVVAGEPVPPELVDRHHELLENVPLYNEYGPTEASVWSTVARCQPGEHRVPIGRSIPGWQAYVLDQHLQPVPTGVTGELYLSGHGIVRGYLNRPGLTADRFLPNPYGEPGSRMYRTGDLARLRADGQLDFLGRVDHQVKIRGYRIELDEIDAVLARHPAVRAAVTVARDGQLVSYVAGEDSALPEIRGFLGEHLPPWMRPAHLMALPELPRTPNDKIDRNRLPEPRSVDTAAPGFQAPGTPAEQRVAEVWRSLLRLDAVGLDQNFFELGGHSLLLVQAHELLLPLKADLRIVDLFRYPTIRTLAAFLSGDAGEPDGADDRHDERRAGRTRQEQRRRRLRGSPT